MKQYLVQKENDHLKGIIQLDGSKSISNRVLIIRALCESSFKINRLSSSDDTQTLDQLLKSNENTLNAHHAGTTYRFMCSYLCLKKGEHILTGSERMKERPIGPLVNALRTLGVQVKYLEKEGYPPIRIGHLNPYNYHKEIAIPADISSQYISSLLLIAPILKEGLKIQLVGNLVSRPYLEMTLSIMEYFGVKHEWNKNEIYIPHQKYQAREFNVEADWSAASYYYIMAAFSNKPDLLLKGLHEESLQGDRAIVDIMESFGIRSKFQKNGLKIKRIKKEKKILDHDFIKEPDIAQSVAVACAGTGKNGIMTGLQTLKIKETQRIDALKKELKKVNVFFNIMPSKFSKKSKKEYYMVEGIAEPGAQVPEFDTYKDHRMAMAFAPLSMLFPVIINEPDVVSKSYPAYWEDLKSLGFEVTELSSRSES